MGSRFRSFLFFAVILLAANAVFAQQTGSIGGKVTTTDGQPLPGVTVEARSNVLPQPRVTTTEVNGEYRMPQLPPGRYTVRFSLSGMQTKSRDVQVFLNQETTANMQLGVEALAETITVTAENPLIDTTSTEVKSALSAEVFDDLPVGQEYRDLIKLIPSVQYTEMAVRGPSAGGSGQDNMYQFDGVNVTLPLFGTLSAEPATQDVAQISVVKGGAKATDFNRSAGFTIDSVSKSGTAEFKGEVGYKFQNSSMVGDPDRAIVLQADTTRSWANANLGGPILRDRLFFFGSYYRPEVTREGGTNAYGKIPDFESTRDEYFGKLTFTPTGNILLHGSYRDSSREGKGGNIGSFATPSVATSGAATFKVGILEGSWILSPGSFATFKVTDYGNETSDRPDIIVDVKPSITPGARLDLANLDRMGAVSIPTAVAGNQVIASLIDRYGFLSNGVKTGGGVVGVASQINDQDFFRSSWQVGYNHALGRNVTHDLHVGYQWMKDEEDLRRTSNGWGSISVPAGRQNCPSGTACAGQPIFYQARFIRSTGDVPSNNIHSELVSQNLEVNDTIRWGNWSFNAGVVVSRDTLYGQGLKNDPSTLSGYVLAPGSKYTMYEIDWEKQIQPRIGTTWAYNGEDNVYVSYAKYNPPATSLPRAAAWDRALINLFYDVYFDQNGTVIGSSAVGSSSGKLFQKDLDPRYVDEYLIGTSQQITSRWAARAYARHRYSSNFWEDTNNDAAQRWAPAGYKKDLYIPNLNDQRAQICASNKAVCTGTLSGSTYVIAELENAFTKYYEATIESDWRSGPLFLRGSYTWSQYYGTFDQDNTTTNNDAAIFVGSSFLADGVGTQIWDNKYGFLKGDRRHLLKLLSTYRLPWRGTVGAIAVFQSGEPWEKWSYEPYRNIPGFSGLNDINRYAEPAGSRRGPSHYQIDVNYSQNFPVAGFNLQLDVDIFNLLDKQTGYNIQPAEHSAGFGQPRSYYSPRRLTAALRFQF
ncbi:MAG TPA: carboxypeptidase regulatory-like domain-containing protein [Thermoanaerobaculia bacterium]|nr:carboxypeptidase regulatory-like domain-containing protein [Thermoanaerobaculia bacterium]